MANKTLKMKDGFLRIDQNTGRFVSIQGQEKLRQDLAEAQMDTFDPVSDWGSELEVGTTMVSLPGAENIVQRLVEEAVLRLMRKQEANPLTEDTEKIDRFQVFVMQDSDALSFNYLLIVDPQEGGGVTEAMAASLGQQEALTKLYDIQV